MPTINPTALENDLLLRGVWEGLGTPECHITGGYVRDRLLGRENVDLDLVLPGNIEALTGPARRLAARLDTRAHVLGRDTNRVWRIQCPEIKIELWPLGNLSLEDDIRRRDFSCNALFWQLPNGPLDDRIGGRQDLENGVIHALSKQNLDDDPVRLVRAPRLLAQLKNFELDSKSTVWIKALAPHLADAPRERVGQELLKLLAAPGAELGLRALLDLELLAPTAPAGAKPDPTWLGANLGAAARLVGEASHPLTAAVREAGRSASLGLLLHAWGVPATHAVRTYAWGAGDRRHAIYAASHLAELANAVDASPGERRLLIHRAGKAFPAALALAAAVEPDHRGWRRWWRQWTRSGHELIDLKPFLSGQEVADLLGVEPGPELGRAISALAEAAVQGEVRTAEGARRWLRRNNQTLECRNVEC
jgi:tRNA nucleotidyltransferase (CCA-adding enzyme)